MSIVGRRIEMSQSEPFTLATPYLQSTSNGLPVLVAALTLGLLVGCSLFGFGDFDLMECNCDAGDNSKCLDINSIEGIPEDSCYQWQCHESGWGCDKRPLDFDNDKHFDYNACKDELLEGPLDCDDSDPTKYFGAVDICDGIDNNCNGYIDEGKLGDVELHTIELAGILSDKDNGELKNPIILSMASSRTADFLGVVQTEEYSNRPDISRAWLFQNVEESKKQLSYIFWDDTGQQLEGCPNKDGKKDDCDIHQLAFDLIDNQVIVATTNAKDNICGQLRIGLLKTEEYIVNLGSFVEQKAILDNEDSFVVDYSCPNNDDEGGVLYPSIAGISQEGEYAEALVMWLDSHLKYSPRSPGCSESTGPNKPVPLQARRVSVSGLNGENPVIEPRYQDFNLESTYNQGPPAIVPWESKENKGAIAAYINHEKRLAFSIFTLENSEKMGLKTCSQSIPSEQLDQVAISLIKEQESDSYQLIAVFRETCSETARIGVALYGFSPSKEPRCSDLSPKDIVWVNPSKGMQLEEGPVLAFWNVVPKADNVTSFEEWTVMWIEHSEKNEVLWGWRFGQKKGSLSKYDEEPFLLVRRNNLSSPVAFTRSTELDSSVYFSVVDHDKPGLIWGITHCKIE